MNRNSKKGGRDLSIHNELLTVEVEIAKPD